MGRGGKTQNDDNWERELHRRSEGTRGEFIENQERRGILGIHHLGDKL